MSWHDHGNQPINSTYVPVAAPSTATVMAAIDSTRLGTAFFTANQSRIFQVTYVVGSDTVASWQLGVARNTVSTGAIDVFYPKTSPSLSAQYVVQHTLEKDQILLALQASTGLNGAAFISAVPLT